MPIINLTEEELTKLWEAVNDGTEPPPSKPVGTRPAPSSRR